MKASPALRTNAKISSADHGREAVSEGELEDGIRL